MSVVSIDVNWEEEARIQQTSREWRAWLTVQMSDVNDGPREMLRDSRVLKFAPYQPHPKDAASLVSEFFPRRLERGTNFWTVEVAYSTQVDVTQNPLGMPAIVTIDTAIREVPAIFDADGNPVINTAGILLADPPATRKVVDKIFKISKNISLSLPDWTDTHVGCVNSDTVRIRGRTYQPGTLFFAGLEIGEEMNVPGTTDSLSTLRSTPYTTANLELLWREDTWVELFLNRGYSQIVPKVQLSPAQEKILNDTSGTPGRRKMDRLRIRFPNFDYYLLPILLPPVGDLPPEPMFLDANGRAILNPTFDDIVVLAYDGHKKRPFNILPGCS